MFEQAGLGFLYYVVHCAVLRDLLLVREDMRRSRNPFEEFKVVLVGVALSQLIHIVLFVVGDFLHKIKVGVFTW